MNIALLTAAGTGSRMNQDIPKQFIHVKDKPILVYTLEAFQNHPEIDAICVSVLHGWEEMLRAYGKQFNIDKLKYITVGGESGQESIFNGLKFLYEQCDGEDVVLIHDGNRPMVSREIITDSLIKYREFGDAVAAIPCTEVVFTSDDKKISNNFLERSLLQRTQTPHTYKLRAIYDAYIEANNKGITDCAASCEIMHKLGRTSHFSLGSEKNLKITTVDDIDIFKALINLQKDGWIK